MADNSKLGKERYRFIAIALVAFIGAAIQLFFIPERLPQLPKTFAEQAYTTAREQDVSMPLSALTGGKWQQAKLVYPGDDISAICKTLGNANDEGRTACETIFAKPPRELVLLGMLNGKLARMEQVPANLVDLQGCGRQLDASQIIRLSRNRQSLMAELHCKGE